MALVVMAATLGHIVINPKVKSIIQQNNFISFVAFFFFFFFNKNTLCWARGEHSIDLQKVACFHDLKLHGIQYRRHS